MAKSEEERDDFVRVRADAELREDLDSAARATGIRNTSDLIRHAVKMLVRAHKGPR